MNVHESNLGELAEDTRNHIHNIEQDTDGLEFYVVGGSVRDSLMDREYNDLDFVVVGAGVDEMFDRGFRHVDASSFPVFLDSEGMEWALARTENKAGEGYHGFEIETEDVTLMDDLGRRDLRINAMALDVFGDTGMHVLRSGDDWELLGRAAGKELEDIEEERLHPVGSAFKDDPIRTLRLSRYAARLGFDPSDHAIRLSREVAYELNRCSRERIGDEIVKAMEQAEEPRRFWEVLRDTGALAVIFPELDRATLVPAGPEAFHMEGDTFEHTMMVLDQMHELCEEQNIHENSRVRRLLMAVAHDIGKVIIADEKGGLLSDPPERFGGHADVGAANMPHIAQKMGLEKQYEKVMQDAADFHMTFFDLAKTIDVVPDEEASYNVKWAYSLLSNFDYEHDPNESKVYGATPWEMLDLIQADHEGRLEPDAEVEKIAGTWTFPTPEDGDVETTSPELDREPYERVMDAVYNALGQADGFRVMREGLCDEHAGQDPPDEELSGILSRCDDCRSPDAWIGERIDELTVELIKEELS